jgi:hypothetical protein
VVTIVDTARPAPGAAAAPCPGTVSIDASWLPAVSSSDFTLHELEMRDPGPTCGGRHPALPAAFRLLPPPLAAVTQSALTSESQQGGSGGGGHEISWHVSCDAPGVRSFATMLVIESAGAAAGARDFLATATANASAGSSY